MIPTIGQYIDSMGASFGLFRTLGDVMVERDAYGEVKVRSGNNAVAFKVSVRDEYKMLKCYTKPKTGLGELYSYIETLRSPLIADIGLLEDEIFVYDHNGDGRYYDVLYGEWVRGNTLEVEVRRCVARRDNAQLENLARMFDQLAIDLLEQEWAHGDLKPENIIVRPDGGMVLIDLDAMFIPLQEGRCTEEVGTPSYQHPLRGVSMYDKHIDDYSIAAISASLHILALNPEMYTHKADYMVFDPSSIVAGGDETYKKMMAIAAYTTTNISNLICTLVSPTPYISNIRACIRDLL